jgi:hypothetical protein
MVTHRSAIRSLVAGVMLLTPIGIASAQPATADLATFKKDIQPFLAQHCLKCHDATKKKGDLTLHDISGNAAAGRDLAKWTAIAERIKSGDMPPEGETQPAPEREASVTNWIDAELAKAGQRGTFKPGSLKAGNHVPHEWLFDPNAEFPLDSPPRLWRISPFIYTTIAKDQHKNAKLSQPFAFPAGNGFKDQAGTLGIDGSTAAQLLRNAETLVDDQLGLPKGKPGMKKVAEFAPLLDESKPATRSQIEAAIAKQFELALKRKPTAEERTRFVALHDANVKTGGAEAGTRVTLMTVWMLPEAVFRLELGGQVNAEPRKLLAPRELAFAIAYALTDRPPDKMMLDASESGKLRTPGDVEREARRLLDDPKVEKPRILRFFREYFGYAEAVNVFKNDKDFPGHDARGLIEDTDQLVHYVLAADRDVFRELLTTNKSFVAFNKTDEARRRLADEVRKFEELKQRDPQRAATKTPPGEPKKLTPAAYNLTEYVPASAQPVELPREQRAGILTQPAWLVAMSDNTDNHAIRRGKWVRERLLGGTVPDIPIGFDAQLPDAPHKTLRERMAVTREAYCWQCHAKMNPIGLGFEMFDHFGRFRTEELGKPVDASAVVDRVGDKAVEANAANAVEMIRNLANTDRARQMFVRHAFRYWAGRDENLGDAKSLRAADAAYVKSGGSMKALVVAILTSDSFLYRTP